MTKENTQRVPCAECDAMVLPRTAEKNGGLCALCRRKRTCAQEDTARQAARAAASAPPTPAALPSYPSVPYEQWSTEPHARWIDAGHTFGTHLMKYVRDQALGTMPKEVAEDMRQAVTEAVRTSLHAMMALMDGAYRCDLGRNHEVEFALLARVRDVSGNPVEAIELAPDGDGLAMGLAGWWQNEFWNREGDPSLRLGAD